MFSRSPSFKTIPKACGFEAATLSASILLCGSLIPIVVIGMGMALTRACPEEFEGVNSVEESILNRPLHCAFGSVRDDTLFRRNTIPNNRLC